MSASAASRAVKIACGIEDQATGGSDAGRAVDLEVEQHLFRPNAARRGYEFENHAAAYRIALFVRDAFTGATFGRGSVKVARRIEC